MYTYPRAFSNPTMWVRPDNLYIVSTDQGKFKIRAQRLDYKQTISQYRKEGYTNVRITCLGYDVTM